MLARLRTMLERRRSRREAQHAQNAGERGQGGYDPRLFSMKGDATPADMSYMPKVDEKRDRF